MEYNALRYIFQVAVFISRQKKSETSLAERIKWPEWQRGRAEAKSVEQKAVNSQQKRQQQLYQKGSH